MDAAATTTSLADWLQEPLRSKSLEQGSVEIARTQILVKVIRLGGIFFKSRDAATLAAYCATHLDLEAEEWGSVRFGQN